MKILKLLNKKNLSIVVISLTFPFLSIAEDEPVDIWNIDKKEIETTREEIVVVDQPVEITENSVYQMQTDRDVNSIELDQNLISKETKIVGLYLSLIHI